MLKRENNTTGVSTDTSEEQPTTNNESMESAYEASLLEIAQEMFKIVEQVRNKTIQNKKELLDASKILISSKIVNFLGRDLINADEYYLDVEIFGEKEKLEVFFDDEKDNEYRIYLGVKCNWDFDMNTVSSDKDALIKDVIFEPDELTRELLEAKNKLDSVNA